MSASRRKGHEEEPENHERWAVSYADMMTVLLATFIVLYAMSAIDQEKFEELRQSLALGFGHEAASIIPGSTGTMLGLESFEIAPDFTSVATDGAEGGGRPAITEVAEDNADYLAAVREYDQLSDVQRRLQERLAERGLADNVTFQIDDRGLVVGLVGSNVFFAADTAELTKVARRVVDTLAGPLRHESRELSIEGHANTLPSSNFASNWELSSERATRVLRRFVESGGIPGDQISATGFGDARPLIDGKAEDAIEGNRRVDIVVRSSASDEVRALLPEIDAALEAGTVTPQELRDRIAAAEAQKEAADL
ncbi:OmpA/MotB family protein [Demequina mangrovi]|uniref:Chemotaxis protein MotB n=1 Tax=Demequina mangrovi TaxID=1043493 RepID=A0A1H7A4T2_9MICO|nr:flagellar motor protein MotB [Demequina mangrovi]SEJ56055.1 chemotaxis protein MotB [Demequina mangrovi]